MKQKTKDGAGNDGIKDIKIMVLLKYLRNFCRILEIPLINYEVDLILTWSKNCFLSDGIVEDQVSTFAITDTTFYVPAVTLSTQDNAKLLRQIKSGFKTTVNWNNYQSKAAIQASN